MTGFEFVCEDRSESERGLAASATRNRRGGRWRLVVLSVAGLSLTACVLAALLWWQDRPLQEVEHALVQGENVRPLSLVNAYLDQHGRGNRALILKARTLVSMRQWSC